MANFGFLKGNIETIILNSLFTGDKYGYEIAKEIKEKTNNQYEIKQATLYSYLKRLETRDLVRSYWGEESHGGRRRYFALSDHGREECKKFSAE
ncbi:MAG: PadR family transcriptional regulator, partial [Firmicutes bacterium]|nr:PadR family transcriptional regulator [Bacillota bacterium]